MATTVSEGTIRVHRSIGGTGAAFRVAFVPYGEGDDAKPDTALPKRWTVDQQNCPAREKHHCYQRQKDPQHPLSKSSVSSGSHVMIARRGHAGYDRRENGVESLINFSQPVRGADDCAVDTDGCKRHTRRAPNEVPEHDEVQPGYERVNQLINADGSSKSEQ